MKNNNGRERGKGRHCKDDKMIYAKGAIKRKNHKRTISFKIADKEFVLDKQLLCNNIIRNK